MSEKLNCSALGKRERYEELLPQLAALLAGETDPTANMANLSAALRESFGWLWVGFYFVRGEELVLGPFQGPIACARIPKGRGVCGAAWAEARTIVVPDVELFDGHIACSSLSRSEIVVPLSHEGEIWAVLDIDSDKVAAFDAVDAHFLELVAALLRPSFTPK
ncbi:MAG: GAF domain-containing protein [Tidjanibacter sp.]|nr:GAF domain-containing protein [Tidjanibacter sp.]